MLYNVIYDCNWLHNLATSPHLRPSQVAPECRHRGGGQELHRTRGGDGSTSTCRWNWGRFSWEKNSWMLMVSWFPDDFWMISGCPDDFLENTEEQKKKMCYISYLISTSMFFFVSRVVNSAKISLGEPSSIPAYQHTFWVNHSAMNHQIAKCGYPLAIKNVAGKSRQWNYKERQVCSWENHLSLSLSVYVHVYVYIYIYIPA